MSQKQVERVRINDLIDTKTLAHLLKGTRSMEIDGEIGQTGKTSSSRAKIKS
jgi:hypothetical protein